MRIFITAALALTLAACTAPTQTKINIAPLPSTIPVIQYSVPDQNKTDEQRIEETLTAPEPKTQFKEGAPVRTPVGCGDGVFRGVDC